MNATALLCEPLDVDVIQRYTNMYPSIHWINEPHFGKLDGTTQRTLLLESDVVVQRNTLRLSHHQLEGNSRLRCLVCACSGTDILDTELLSSHGISYTACPDGNAESVAEHVIGFLFVLSKHLVQANEQLKSGIWAKETLFPQELKGKTMGLIGYGRIGKLIAKKASALGLRLIAFDPMLKESDEYTTVVSFNQVFVESDFVSVNVPLLDSTRYCIDDAQFQLMKKTAFLIHCSRGGVVREEALIRACQTQTIAGAALDVFEDEKSPNAELLQLKSVIVTPHIAGQTRESLERNTQTALQIAADFILNRHLSS